MNRCSLTQGGFEQKPTTRASTWYGVQQATNAPKMKDIVRNALRTRFSEIDCGRLSLRGPAFLLPFSLLPIDRMKSRLLDVCRSRQGFMVMCTPQGMVFSGAFGFWDDVTTVVVGVDTLVACVTAIGGEGLGSETVLETDVGLFNCDFELRLVSSTCLCCCKA